MNYMNFHLIAPQLVVLCGAVLVILVEIIAPNDNRARIRDLSPALSLLTLVFTVVTVALRWPLAGEVEGFSHMIVGDHLALAAQALLALAGFLSVLAAWNYLRVVGEDHGEYYALLLTSVFGGMIMVGAVDLIMIFLGLEILSISIYALAGFLRRRLDSGESALKYFFLGAFSTGFLLYGMSLIFGAVGSLHFAAIAEKLALGEGGLLLKAGLALLLVGFGFKIAAFPFHVWTPDVYQGAPSPTTGFMAAAVKIAAFVTLLRVLVGAFDPWQGKWIVVVYYLALATMIFGNIAALVQTRLKRLLAYSSIAHAGYLLVGVAALVREPALGIKGVLFYLLAYTLMTVGAFAVVSHLSRESADADNLDGYRGLARRHPWLAAALAIFLVSMAGLPPLVGFVGKFVVFYAAVKAKLIHLVVVAVLTSAISVYYYIRVLYVMYMAEPAPDVEPITAPTRDLPGRAVLILTALAVLILGVLPHVFLHWAEFGALSFLGF